MSEIEGEKKQSNATCVTYKKERKRVNYWLINVFFCFLNFFSYFFLFSILFERHVSNNRKKIDIILEKLNESIIFLFPSFYIWLIMIITIIKKGKNRIYREPFTHAVNPSTSRESGRGWRQYVNFFKTIFYFSLLFLFNLNLKKNYYLIIIYIHIFQL